MIQNAESLLKGGFVLDREPNFIHTHDSISLPVFWQKKTTYRIGGLNPKQSTQSLHAKPAASCILDKYIPATIHFGYSRSGNIINIGRLRDSIDFKNIAAVLTGVSRCAEETAGHCSTDISLFTSSHRRCTPFITSTSDRIDRT